MQPSSRARPIAVAPPKSLASKAAPSSGAGDMAAATPSAAAASAAAAAALLNPVVAAGFTYGMSLSSPFLSAAAAASNGNNPFASPATPSAVLAAAAAAAASADASVAPSPMLSSSHGQPGASSQHPAAPMSSPDSFPGNAASNPGGAATDAANAAGACILQGLDVGLGPGSLAGNRSGMGLVMGLANGRSGVGASRHMAAEQRRRARINERLDALRSLVPHSARANTAAFLSEVYEYVSHLHTELERLGGGKREAEWYKAGPKQGSRSGRARLPQMDGGREGTQEENQEEDMEGQEAQGEEGQRQEDHHPEVERHQVLGQQQPHEEQQQGQKPKHTDQQQQHQGGYQQQQQVVQGGFQQPHQPMVVQEVQVCEKQYDQSDHSSDSQATGRGLDLNVESTGDEEEEVHCIRTVKGSACSTEPAGGGKRRSPMGEEHLEEMADSEEDRARAEGHGDSGDGARMSPAGKRQRGSNSKGCPTGLDLASAPSSPVSEARRSITASMAVAPALREDAGPCAMVDFMARSEDGAGDTHIGINARECRCRGEELETRLQLGSTSPQPVDRQSGCQGCRRAPSGPRRASPDMLRGLGNVVGLMPGSWASSLRADVCGEAKMCGQEGAMPLGPRESGPSSNAARAACQLSPLPALVAESHGRGAATPGGAATAVGAGAGRQLHSSKSPASALVPAHVVGLSSVSDGGSCGNTRGGPGAAAAASSISVASGLLGSSCASGQLALGAHPGTVKIGDGVGGSAFSRPAEVLTPSGHTRATMNPPAHAPEAAPPSIPAAATPGSTQTPVGASAVAHPASGPSMPVPAGAAGSMAPAGPATSSSGAPSLAPGFQPVNMATAAAAAVADAAAAAAAVRQWNAAAAMAHAQAQAAAQAHAQAQALVRAMTKAAGGGQPQARSGGVAAAPAAAPPKRRRGRIPRSARQPTQVVVRPLAIKPHPC